MPKTKLDLGKIQLQTIALATETMKKISPELFDSYYFSPNEKRFSNRKGIFEPMNFHCVDAPYFKFCKCETTEIKMYRISRIHIFGASMRK